MTTTLPAAGIALPQLPQAPVPAGKKKGKAKAAPVPAKKATGKKAAQTPPPAPATSEVPVPAPTLIPILEPVEIHQNLLTGKIVVKVNDRNRVEVVHA